MTDRRVILFGGTTEGREAAFALADMGFAVTVSVATPLGGEELGSRAGMAVRCGRLDSDEMAELMRGASLCVDATHPYAVEASANIKKAASKVGVEYLRLSRGQSALPQECLVYDSAVEAASALGNTEGNILLTTGAKELPAFAAISSQRIYPRVLPTLESIAACEKADIPHRNIIAMQGPFSLELNEAILRQFDIKYIVTKDGGAAGGFEAKAQAAANTGATLVVVRRPDERGGMTMEELLRRCEEALKCE